MPLNSASPQVSRRNALLTAAAFPYHLYAGTTKKSATDRVTLGPKKIQLARLAMGSGTSGVGGSSNQTRKLGVNGLAELIRAAGIDRFRREVGTEYLDILLLQKMMEEDWPERRKGTMAVISEMRQKGIVRTKGLSCQNAGGADNRCQIAFGGSALGPLYRHGIAMDDQDLKWCSAC